MIRLGYRTFGQLSLNNLPIIEKLIVSLFTRLERIFME